MLLETPFVTFFGCYPKASKYHLIVNIQYFARANVVLGNTKVNLTSEGMPHFGAAIESHLYKEKYVSELVMNLSYTFPMHPFSTH